MVATIHVNGHFARHAEEWPPQVLQDYFLSRHARSRRADRLISRKYGRCATAEDDNLRSKLIMVDVG